MDEINNTTATYMARIAIERMKAELMFKEACRNGFYCIRCRQPFQDIGIAFVCDCPPGAIKNPVHFTEDLPLDIQKGLNENWIDLLEE